MRRIRNLFTQSRPTYEPLEGGSVDQNGDRIDGWNQRTFSWKEYSVFLLLGVAMLWAWCAFSELKRALYTFSLIVCSAYRNIFLAAAPYFQRRFDSNDWILTHFQSAIISISTTTNLVFVVVLAKLQSKASYPKRIASSLIMNTICFTLLALSTVLFRRISADSYFAFLMLMVFTASLATGFSQNGVFAYVAGFGREEYTQAIMTGQAIAGVLPCIARKALGL